MALGFLGDLLGLNAGEATKDSARWNQGVITNYETQGNNIINDSSSEANSYLRKVLDLYEPFSGAGNMYADATGLNGGAGSDRATAAFRTAPGYEFQRDQSLNALDRRAAAAGRLQSGNADIDAMTYATGLADQSYGSWLDRLASQSNTALNGVAGGYNNLANLATGTGTQRMGLAGDVASNRMAGNNQYAQGEEANKAGIASLGGNLLGMAGKAFGWGGF